MSQKDIDKLIEGKEFHNKYADAITNDGIIALRCQFDTNKLQYYVELKYNNSGDSATEYYEYKDNAVDRFNELKTIHELE